MTIYDRIRDLRISLKLSQTDLANKMGYKSGSMITKIESGKVDISQKKIIAFANALNTTPGYLMGWTDIIHPTTTAELTADEDQLVTSYRSLSPHGKALLQDRAKELQVLHGKKSESDTALTVQIKG